MARGDEKKIGSAFEELIEHKIAVAASVGLVGWYQHNEPGWRKAGRQWVPAEQSGADFAGVFTGGLAWGLECKSIAPGERFSLQSMWDPKRKGWKRQKLHLDALADSRCLSLLALEFRREVDDAIRYLIPWRSIPWVIKRSAATVGLEELAPLAAFRMRGPDLFAGLVFVELDCETNRIVNVGICR